MQDFDENDNELINKHLQEDSSAFPKLLNHHLKAVFNFAFRLSGNSSEAEDITQETFFKIWKNLKKFKPEENFKTWMFAIARNTAIDFIRKKRAVPFSNFESDDGENPIADNLESDLPSPDQIAEMAGEKQRLLDTIDKLSAIQKQILLLRANENLTFEEISKIMEKPMNTVKSVYRRALFALRAYLESNR
jgi:RNA polymerase sigma-70 factor (ECF subfamily)